MRCCFRSRNALQEADAGVTADAMAGLGKSIDNRADA
jgi:hypothetical protein